MFVSPAFSGPVFRERSDRREGQRFPYKAVVQINGRTVPGRDISPKGLSVLLAAPAVGEVVRVTLAAASANTAEISSKARVVRVESEPEGFVIGLEFID